jgi:hypothetical protein
MLSMLHTIESMIAKQRLVVSDRTFVGGGNFAARMHRPSQRLYQCLFLPKTAHNLLTQNSAPR